MVDGGVDVVRTEVVADVAVVVVVVWEVEVDGKVTVEAVSGGFPGTLVVAGGTEAVAVVGGAEEETSVPVVPGTVPGTVAVSVPGTLPVWPVEAVVTEVEAEEPMLVVVTVPVEGT